jgi:diadenosine tetraphosphate (Ap4A) HIT family hydrolase
MSYTCEECGFDLWRYVGQSVVFTPGGTVEGIEKEYANSCHVGLYSDHRYPGRCLVVFDKHKEHLEDLSDFELSYFMRCVTKVGQAVKEIVGAKRMNYSVLGNAVPHVHAHVIPRFETDPNPNQSPWNRHDKAGDLTKERATEIIEALRKALSNGA